MRRWLLIAIGVMALAIIAYEYQPARYGALYCLDTAAADWGRWMWEYDGYLIGAGGCLYAPARTPPEQVMPVVAGTAPSRDEPALWFVNGANLRVDWVMAQLLRTAASTGHPVVGFYNATYGGRFVDGLLDIRYGSRVVETLADATVAALERGRSVHIRATSQGALFTSQALYRVRRRLIENMGEARTLALMATVRVETGGGAASQWPDGPRYVHYVNVRDPVVRYAGVLSDGAQPGRGAVIAEFEAFNENPLGRRFRWLDPWTMRYLGVHGFSVYNEHRRPFDAVYRQGGGGSGINRVPITGCCGGGEGRSAVAAPGGHKSTGYEPVGHRRSSRTRWEEQERFFDHLRRGPISRARQG